MFFYAELQHQKRISPFYRQRCRAKLCSHRSSALLLLSNVVRGRQHFALFYAHLKLNFCGVMFSHVARVWADIFAVLVFLHSSILEFARGHTIKQLPMGTDITRALQAPELDQVYRSLLKLQASASQARAGSRPLSPILSKWFPDHMRAPCMS